jgi:hypothetical protein
LHYVALNEISPRESLTWRLYLAAQLARNTHLTARSQHSLRSSSARTDVAHDNQMATKREHHCDHEITKRSHLAHNLDLARTPGSMKT